MDATWDVASICFALNTVPEVANRMDREGTQLIERLVPVFAELGARRPDTKLFTTKHGDVLTAGRFADTLRQAASSMSEGAELTPVQQMVVDYAMSMFQGLRDAMEWSSEQSALDDSVLDELRRTALEPAPPHGLAPTTELG